MSQFIGASVTRFHYHRGTGDCFRRSQNGFYTSASPTCQLWRSLYLHESDNAKCRV